MLIFGICKFAYKRKNTLFDFKNGHEMDTKFNSQNIKKGVLTMAQTVNVNFRMDEDLKKSMEKVCADMGLSVATAFTIFMKRDYSYRVAPFCVITCSQAAR